MLIWTIHDFPEYGIVVGVAHQGHVQYVAQSFGGCIKWNWGIIFTLKHVDGYQKGTLTRPLK